jgi:hypothetical protein
MNHCDLWEILHLINEHIWCTVLCAEPTINFVVMFYEQQVFSMYRNKLKFIFIECDAHNFIHTTNILESIHCLHSQGRK